jgi:hypothetical protein
MQRLIKRPDICEQPDSPALCATALRRGWVYICHKNRRENQRRAPRKALTAQMITLILMLIRRHRLNPPAAPFNLYGFVIMAMRPLG